MSVSADRATRIREALEEWVPTGYRDDFGVWHDGPLLDAALADIQWLLDRDRAATQLAEAVKEWRRIGLLQGESGKPLLDALAGWEANQ